MTIQQEIFDFISSKSGANAPTTSVEIADFKAQLSEKVARLSVGVNAIEGAVTLLYSGQLYADPNGNGTQNLYSYQIAESIGTSSLRADGKVQVITIGQTESGRVLGSSEFRIALSQAVGQGNASLILDGINSLGERVNNTSLFDQTSKRLVYAAPGDFITMALDGRSDGVFGQTELAAALDGTNTKPKYINGALISDLVSIRNEAIVDGATFSEATNRIRAVTATDSLVDIAKLDISKITSADPLIPDRYVVGTERYFSENAPNIKGAPLGSEYISQRIDSIALVRDVVEGNRAELTVGYETIRDSRFLKGLNLTSSAVNSLGAAGAAVGFVLAVSDANQAIKVGDSAQAGRIMSGWATGLGGALAVGTSFAAGTAANFWYLAYGGPVGVAALTVLSVGAGIVGGFVGEKGAHALFESIWPSTTIGSNLTPPFSTQTIPQFDSQGRITGYTEEVPISAEYKGRGLVEYQFGSGAIRTTTGNGNDPSDLPGQLPAVNVFSFSEKILVPKEGGGYAELVTSTVAGDDFNLRVNILDQNKINISAQQWSTTVDKEAGVVNTSQSTITYNPKPGVQQVTKVTDFTISNDGTHVPTQITTNSVLTNGVVESVIQDGNSKFIRASDTEYFYDENGQSRIETNTKWVDGKLVTSRDSYDTDGNLYKSDIVPPNAMANVTDASTLSNGQINTYVNTTTDVINFGASVLNGKLPAAYNFASGISLIDKNINLLKPDGSYRFPVLNQGAVIAQGAQSLYNLGQTFASGGNTLGKVNALGNTLNYVNTTLINNVALNSALNGTGAVFNGARDGLVSGGSFNGIANGGTPGVLPVVGLLLAIKSGDPVGIVQGAVGLFNPALLAGPVGWALAAVSIFKILFPKAPPKAWGTANITYGEGVLNTALLVNAQGESFGTARAKQTLEGTVANLNSYINQANTATNQNNNLTADQKADMQLGIIAQRMPSLSWRASDLNDKGYSLTEIDPLTGEQKLPYRRFDDDGVPFSSNPNAYTVDLSDPAQRQNLNTALLTAAQERGALAPMWEVNTAKMQANAGAVNAGLSEEERAAKAGYAAPVDTAYVATHQADYAGKPVSAHKRVGSFMAVGLDLDSSGTISTTTVAQNATKAPGGQAINFNWDNTGYQKKVGWVSANDAMLVLDKDFNQSVDNGTELLSNPLVADPAKGLRSLATWDANADGVINSLDPVYRQLKVWQDFNQDGDNTSYKTIGGRQQAVQDERLGDDSQICSELSPDDDDILAKDLKSRKLENKTEQQSKPARVCARLGRRTNQVPLRKKWQCQRHMVIISYEKCSKNRRLKQTSESTKLGGAK